MLPKLAMVVTRNQTFSSDKQTSWKPNSSRALRTAIEGSVQEHALSDIYNPKQSYQGNLRTLRSQFPHPLPPIRSVRSMCTYSTWLMR